MAYRGQRAFTLLELMIVVAIIGVLAAVAIPAFTKYVRKTRTVEAREQIRRIVDGARAYLADGSRTGRNHYGRRHETGPPESMPATPALGTCCAQGGKCAPDARLWTSETWRALMFSVPDPHYYSYTYILGEGELTARANGDLDCDGEFSTFEIYGGLSSLLDPETPTAGFGIHRSNELE